MPRCSQKTAKGLRCKSHGIETNGKIICATHLKHMDDSSMPDLVPVSSVPTPTPTPITTKEFDSVLSEMMSMIYPDYTARNYLSNLRSTHHILVKLFNDGISDCKTSETNWKFHVNDTLDHILSTRLAGMPEDITQWDNNDAQLNTLMNKLTAIHKAMLTQPLKPVNPDRPETLEAAYARIDELQKKIAEMTEQLAIAKEKSKEAAEGSLWKSGCEDMCYHLGNCSDVMGDCWVPVYHESDLDGLKNHLREVSKEHHHGKACEECSETINRLHD